jgi:hypothetical protein
MQKCRAHAVGVRYRERERESMGKSDRKNKFTSVITVVEVLRVVEVPVPRQNLSPVRVFRSDKIRTI